MLEKINIKELRSILVQMQRFHTIVSWSGRDLGCGEAAGAEGKMLTLWWQEAKTESSLL